MKILYVNDTDNLDSSIRNIARQILPNSRVIKVSCMDEAESIILSDEEIVLLILDLSLPRTQEDYWQITDYRHAIRDLHEQCRSDNSSNSDSYIEAQERIETAIESISELTIRRGGTEMIFNLLKEMRLRNDNALMKFPIPIIFISGWNVAQESFGWSSDIVFDCIQLGINNFEDHLIGKITNLLKIVPPNNPA